MPAGLLFVSFRIADAFRFQIVKGKAFDALLYRFGHQFLPVRLKSGLGEFLSGQSPDQVRIDRIGLGHDQKFRQFDGCVEPGRPGDDVVAAAFAPADVEAGVDEVRLFQIQDFAQAHAAQVGEFHRALHVRPWGCQFEHRPVFGVGDVAGARFFAVAADILARVGFEQVALDGPGKANGEKRHLAVGRDRGGTGGDVFPDDAGDDAFVVDLAERFAGFVAFSGHGIQCSVVSAKTIRAVLPRSAPASFKYPFAKSAPRLLRIRPMPIVVMAVMYSPRKWSGVDFHSSTDFSLPERSLCPPYCLWLRR
jgi:hypothetical protein